MHLFYQEDMSQDLVLLDREESRHCLKVLRMRQGDELWFTDGKGLMCRANLAQADAAACTAFIVERRLAPKPILGSLHMVVAPTKNMDRFEWFLEKATECGVSEITPLICAQSERSVVKPERLQKILISAMKQSQQAYLPRLNPAMSFKSFMQNPVPEAAFIAHCVEGQKQSLRQSYQAGQDAMVLIGPEGDFSPEEIRQALERGFLPISLGNNRLRTETAALVACIEINFINGLL